MFDSTWAHEFAREWIAAWNAHDLERILSHYADDFEMVSPLIIERMQEPAGKLKGKEQIRPYWQLGLAALPPLQFELLGVFAGVDSMVIHYRSIRRKRVCEVLFFNAQRQVVRGAAHYGGADECNVLINRKQYLPDFIRLNEDWISHYFSIEEADRELARNPAGIIANGGYIFTLLEEEQVVGVCALFKEGNEVFQLARMAVSPAFRGKGYGNALLDAALEHLHKIKAGRVYLLSNTVLAPAIALYRKHGFAVLREGTHPVYARCNIVMEKRL